MKINRVTASFGKLQNESLSFHDGLNVIYAPNESGKSTWCAFIRAMLYGIDSSERARTGYLPDKKKYVPWSGAPMQGTMEITADSCNITLTRSTASPAAPMREFSAVYTGTSTPVAGLNGTNVGEELTGVNSEVFRRTAFVEQGAIAVTDNPDLEKRIAAIITSGDESVSYTDADSALKAWQRKRRFNKKGLLPVLEEKMDATEHKLESMQDSTEDAAKLEQSLNAARLECRRLEEEMNENRKLQRKNALTRLMAGRSELDAASREQSDALREYSDAKDSVNAGRFDGRKYKDIKDEADHDIAQIRSLQSVSGSQTLLLAVLAVIFFILSAVFASLYVSRHLLPLAIASVIFMCTAIGSVLSYLRRKRGFESAAGKLQGLLDKYSAESAEDIEALVEDYKKLWDAVIQAADKESAARLKVQDLQTKQQEIESHILGDLDFADGDSKAAKLNRELSAARKKVEDLSTKLASVSGRAAVLGDPMVLRSDLSCMEAEHDMLEQEYEAIGIAIKGLREADAELQSRFSPELGKLASDYMARMTGGRYKNVLIDRNFDAMAKPEGDDIARRSEYLSAGTLDLMYLAVRLAVCELALPSGEPCPLILDDALVNLDDKRCEQAMDLLREIGHDRQVILFTCRKVSTDK